MEPRLHEPQKLREQLEELANFEKRLEKEKPEKKIKVFSKKDFGYKILEDGRNSAEQKAINRSNFEILEFVHQLHHENCLDAEISRKIDNFVENHEISNFRGGALSLAVNFDHFPPEITSRNKSGEHRPILLRSVVIDGPAVQYTATNSPLKPFFNMKNFRTEQIPYSANLILQIKPLFDIIVSFLLRGHKSTVYLPKYYQKFVTLGGNSKVDDVHAFRKLIELKFVEFRQVRRQDKTWFGAVSKVADEKKAVFVSSSDYRPKRTTAVCQFEKPSERIVTPCFLNTEDRLMVLQPEIRYRGADKQFHVIPAEKVLLFGNSNEKVNEAEVLGEQMYLEEQIRLLCELCQLYPMKSVHKIAIKQLLRLLVISGSNFETPHMTPVDFLDLRTKIEVFQ